MMNIDGKRQGMMAGKFSAWLLAVSLAAGGAGAWAAAPAPAAGDVRHRVAAGDTLEALAQAYTGSAANWRELQRVNNLADPRQLTLLSTVVIPARLLLPQAVTARVSHVSGPVQALVAGVTEPRALAIGDMLPEGSQVRTGMDAYALLVLNDGSKVSVLADSQLTLTRLRSQPHQQIQQNSLGLTRGRTEVQAQRLRNSRSRLDIHTPFAVASVRGTVFGVQIQSEQAVTSDVTEGLVAVAAAQGGVAQPGGVTVQAGQGVQVQADGTVSAPRSLLAAPDLGSVPEVLGDGQALVFDLPAVPAGAAGYRVRISDAQTPDVVHANAYVTTPRVNLPSLPDGTYALGVRAVGTEGIPGYEAHKNFRVKSTPLPPQPQLPTPGQQISGTRVSFRCTAPADVRYTRLQVARDASFSALVVDQPRLTACDHQAQLSQGRYFWRVGASVELPNGQLDNGPMGPAQEFDLISAPQVPTDVSFNVDAETFTAQWRAPDGVRYHVQVAKDRGFGELVHSRLVQGNSITVGPLPIGTYYVRMRAIDNNGNTGPFGPVHATRVGLIVR